MLNVSKRWLFSMAAVALTAALATTACDDEGDDGTGGTGGTASGTGGTASGTGGTASGTGGSSSSSSSGGVAGAMPQDATVIFLHHSTGGVIWGGGVADAVSAYNSANDTSYAVTALAYPDSPYPWANYPYDYWHLWVEDGGQATAEGIPTLEEYTGSYDVVVFKHCFPVSGIGPDTGSPDITSESKTIENYQLQYNALRDRLHELPDNRFILWTGAALVEAASSPEEGQRARQFFTWVKDEWDQPGDNIYLWDFFELETEGGSFLLDQHAASPSDSHPSDAFAATVAPFFAQRVIDVIEGRGDVGSLTGQ